MRKPNTTKVSILYCNPTNRQLNADARKNVRSYVRKLKIWQTSVMVFCDKGRVLAKRGFTVRLVSGSWRFTTAVRFGHHGNMGERAQHASTALPEVVTIQSSIALSTIEQFRDFLVRELGSILMPAIYGWWQTLVGFLYLTKTPVKNPGAPGLVHSRSAIYRAYAHIRRRRQIGFLATGMFTEVPVLLKILNVTLHLLEEACYSSLADILPQMKHETRAPMSALSSHRLVALRSIWDEELTDWTSFQKLSHLVSIDDIDFVYAALLRVSGNYYFFTPPVPHKGQAWNALGISPFLNLYRGTPMKSRRVKRTKGRALPFSTIFFGNLRQYWLPSHAEVSVEALWQSLKTTGLRQLVNLDALGAMYWTWDRILYFPAFILSEIYYNLEENWLPRVVHDWVWPNAQIERFNFNMVGKRPITTKFLTRDLTIAANFRFRQTTTKLKFIRNWRHIRGLFKPRSAGMFFRVGYTGEMRWERFGARRFWHLIRRPQWRWDRAWSGKYAYWVTRPSRRSKMRYVSTFFKRLGLLKMAKARPTPRLQHGMLRWLDHSISLREGPVCWPYRGSTSGQQYVDLRPLFHNQATVRALPRTRGWVYAFFKLWSGIGGQLHITYVHSTPSQYFYVRAVSQYGAVTSGLLGGLSTLVFLPKVHSWGKAAGLTSFRTYQVSRRGRSFYTDLGRGFFYLVASFFNPPYYSVRRFRRKRRLGVSSFKRSAYNRTNLWNTSPRVSKIGWRYAWIRNRRGSRPASGPVERVWRVIYRCPRYWRNPYRWLHSAADFYYGGRWVRWQLANSKSAFLMRLARAGVGFKRPHNLKPPRNWNFAASFWHFSNARYTLPVIPTVFQRPDGFDRYRTFASVRYFKPLLKFRQGFEWGFTGFSAQIPKRRHKTFRQRRAARGVFKIPGQSIWTFKHRRKSGILHGNKFRLLDSPPVIYSILKK